MRTLIRCLALLPPAIHPERASVDVLVISPTRELATQIAKQASALATFDNGKIGCVGE
jgi:superfamily II DNA/RNA helicase